MGIFPWSVSAQNRYGFSWQRVSVRGRVEATVEIELDFVGLRAHGNSFLRGIERLSPRNH